MNPLREYFVFCCWTDACPEPGGVWSSFVLFLVRAAARTLLVLSPRSDCSEAEWCICEFSVSLCSEIFCHRHRMNMAKHPCESYGVRGRRLSVWSSCHKSHRQTVSHRCGFSRGFAVWTTPWRTGRKHCRSGVSRQYGRACACGMTAGRRMSSHTLSTSRGSLLCGAWCASSGNIWWWTSYHSNYSPIVLDLGLI